MSIASDLARALDPARIFNDVGLVPYTWQRDLLRTDARRILLNIHRQGAKSSTSCLMAIHTIMTTPGALVLLLSTSQRQSSELFKTLMGFARQIPNVPAISAESALRCEWANGSRVIALPGTERTARGWAGADLVVIDEAARVPDDLIAAIRPTMATKSNSRLICLSTPAGKRGWWYEAWISDEPWLRIKVPASESTTISKEFLDEELRTLGALRFSEEYEVTFVDDTTSVFSVAAIDRCFAHNVAPLWG
jgi:hypothetical protein